MSSSLHIISDSIQKYLANNLSYISQYYQLQDIFAKEKTYHN
jgi:hypothetical protein